MIRERNEHKWRYRCMHRLNPTANITATCPGFRNECSDAVKREPWMNSSQYASDSISTKMPTWLAIVVSFFVALLFARGLGSVNAVSGWMLDDLFSLWTSDRNVPFPVAFSDRILPELQPAPLPFFTFFCSSDCFR